MSDWEKIKLGELYNVHNGLSKGRQFFGTGFPFLSFSTVFNNWFLPAQLDNLVLSTEKEREACSIKRGDVFITRTSETMDELGMSCVALKDYPDATYNGFTKRLRPTTDKVIPEYIGYYLRSPKFRGKFMAFSSMTTRASLANDDLLSMEVEIPPLPTQQRIAELLGRYDDLIDNYWQQIRLLEEAAQRLYREWFVDFCFPGHEDVRFVDGVPEGWENICVDDVFSIKYGKNLSTKEISPKGTYPVYGANGVIGYYDKCNCEQQVVLITSRGNAGDVRMTFHKEAFITNNSFVVIPHEEYSHCGLWFTYFLLKAANFHSVCTGVAQPQLTNASIHYIKVVMPTKDIVQKYNQVSQPLNEEALTLRKQIRHLTEARDRLLPKLMSGEIMIN